MIDIVQTLESFRCGPSYLGLVYTVQYLSMEPFFAVCGSTDM